ncbi:MAG: nitrous oxide reductase accessory protein NosL, partial [Sulfurospirillaceae bacterium]
TDYYTLEALEAKDAFYVVGSDVYGPMGNELIPFSKEANAKTFRDDHKGKQIVSFDEITPELVKTLD